MGVLPDVRGLNGTDVFENTKIVIELEKRASQFNGAGGDLFPRHHIKWPRAGSLPPNPDESCTPSVPHRSAATPGLIRLRCGHVGCHGCMPFTHRLSSERHLVRVMEQA